MNAFTTPTDRKPSEPPPPSPMFPFSASNAAESVPHDGDAGGRGSFDVKNAGIMIVDDVPLNTTIARAHLASEGYRNIITETDSTKVLSLLYQKDPDLLLLDIMMPEVSGLDILEVVRGDRHFAHLPVLILTATTDRDLKIQALELGATDFLNKPIDAQDMIPRVRNALLVKSHQDHLEAMVRARTCELEHAQKEVVYCLARAAEYRDNDTGHHVIRVSRYVALIARKLGLDEQTVDMMSQASMLHDMGKIGIPDSVLHKPGRLNDQDRDLMRRHCEFGFDICMHAGDTKTADADILGSFGQQLLEGCSSPLLQMAASIAATHHEKWDGTGYPRGLAGESIPLEGRITAVADVFDALSSKRPYKEAFPLNRCIAILQDGRGTHFDPHLLDLFLDSMDEVRAIRGEFDR